MALIKWTPMRPATTLRSMMEEVMGDPFFGTPTTWPSARELAINLQVKDDKYLVSTALPGIDVEDVDISVSENTLTIKAENKQEETTEEKEGYLLRECYSGSYYRQITLPSDADVAAAEADNHNGVLTITIPKRPEAQPKKLTIRSKK